MLDQIRYFQAVVRLNSFSEAAEECHISQSAISQQIKALEQALGVQLLNRKNRRFSVTPAGEHFYRKSLILTADYDRLVRETMRLARQDTQTLRVGYLKCYGGDALRSAVAAFTAAHPEVKVELLGGNHEDLYQAIEEGRIDLTMNDQRRMFSDAYVNFSLGYRPCGAELAVRNPMAALSAVSVEEMKNTPCVLVCSKEQQRTEAEYFRGICGIQSELLFAENLEEARLMVVQNNGFLPVDDGPDRFGNTIVRLDLLRGDQPMTRHYCVFWRKENASPLADEFASLLKAEFDRL